MSLKALAVAVVSLFGIACAAALPSPGAPAAGTDDAAASQVVGEWKEYWGTPGKTDVTYHDQYRVTLADGGKITVQILNREQLISDEQCKGQVLTFAQRTDQFVVKYSLVLQDDGKWLIGTATTPKELVAVKWERTK